MTQNSVSRQLQRIYCTENQLLNNHKHSEMLKSRTIYDQKKGQQQF